MNCITIIGAGKLGTSLYNALKAKSSDQIYLIGNRPISNQEIEKQNFSLELTAEIVESSKIIIISVRDEQIINVVDKLIDFQLKRKIIFHTSGAESSDVLFRLCAQGSAVGSLHPIQSFPEPFQPVEIWENITCSYEGDISGIKASEKLCADLGSKLVVLTRDEKRALHLSAVFSSNYLVALYSAATNIVGAETGRKLDLPNVLGPLSQQVLDNYRQLPVEEILSGPLQRGDVATIKQHIELMKEQKLSRELQLYKELAKYLLDEKYVSNTIRIEISKILEKD